MRRLLGYFIVLLMAVWLGVKLTANQGFVLIGQQNTSIEMPLYTHVRHKISRNITLKCSSHALKALNQPPTTLLAAGSTQLSA